MQKLMEKFYKTLIKKIFRYLLLIFFNFHIKRFLFIFLILKLQTILYQVS